MDTSSAAAHEAWRRKYDGPKFEQPLTSLDDTGPFKLGRKLGEGGWGNVYRTELDGVVVALKLLHLFPNKQRDLYVNELKILQKLSGTRHRHVVELIGCFELIGRLRSRIGLLIWPVAQCDLSGMLHYMDILSGLKARLIQFPNSTNVSELLDEEESDALNILSAITTPARQEDRWSLAHDLLSRVQLILDACKDRLYAAFGCLAHAISYLHNDQRIRHRDVNPKQILLSSHGVWLTDFGVSKDISDASGSSTNNGERYSAKYHAPERESKGELPCGRAEDIFALGCTYLEMWYAVCGVSVDDYLNAQGERQWSYQANLHQTDDWLEPLMVAYTTTRWALLLAMLLKTMMAREPQTRPRSEEVAQLLKVIDSMKSYKVFGDCCRPGT